MGRTEQYNHVVDTAREVFIQKNEQYGDSVFTENASSWHDIYVNLNRKFARLEDYDFGYPSGGEDDELLEQIVDLINYSVIFGIRVLEEQGELERLTEDNGSGNVLALEYYCYECDNRFLTAPSNVSVECVHCNKELDAGANAEEVVDEVGG